MQNAKNLYIIKGTESFVRGELDNVTLENNVLRLEQMGGQYVLYGCYTSQPVNFPAFTSLAMSWNAETPKDTVVEAQCRVLLNDEWSSWVSFGKWSPFREMTPVESKSKEQPIYVKNGILYLKEGCAKRAQLRLYLYTDNARLTPIVRLLAASVQPVDQKMEPAEPYGRLLRLPAYSQLVRDPALRDEMDTPCALASLMNRWGQDVLPEEVAHVMRDPATGDCKNHSFAVAAAAAWGCEAYLAYLEPKAVWEHIKAGKSVALELNYSVTESQSAENGYPVLHGGSYLGEKQFMPLRGFELDPEGKVMALVNDSHAPSDKEAEKSYSAEELWAAYSGLALIFTGFHQNKLIKESPLRHHVSLRRLTEVGCYQFLDPDGNVLPVPEDFTGTLAATRREETAWATTAHKKFYYLGTGPQGSVRVPSEAREQGGKLTVYAIWPSGSALVAEISL